MEVEFGSSFPVRFLDLSQVKLYDSEEKELKIPKCDKCGLYKNSLISVSSIKWICQNGCE